jgi:hypothetical protein
VPVEYQIGLYHKAFHSEPHSSFAPLQSSEEIEMETLGGGVDFIDHDSGWSSTKKRQPNLFWIQELTYSAYRDVSNPTLIDIPSSS